MERTAYDSEDDTKDKKNSPLRPVHVPLHAASEGGLLSLHKPEAPKPEADPLLPLREAVMKQVNAYEQQPEPEQVSPAVKPEVPAAPIRFENIPGKPASQHEEDDDEEDDDDTVPAPPPRPKVPLSTPEDMLAPLTFTEAVDDEPLTPARPTPGVPFQHSAPAVRSPFPPSEIRATPLGEAQQPGPPIESLPQSEAPIRSAIPVVETSPSPTANYEPTPRYGQSAEYYKQDRKIAGAFLTSIAISWYLSHRAMHRHEKRNERDFKEVRTQNQRLGEQQTELYQQVARQQQRINRVETQPNQMPAGPGVEAPRLLTAEQFAALQQAQAAPEQPKVHIEQDAWKRYVMVNGKLEQNAIDYGRAFREEQQHEQVGSRFSPYQQNGGPVGGAGPVDAGIPMLQSGQVDTSYQLPASDPPPADLQHRLSPPHHPVTEAVLNPWVWVGLAVLLFAFFATAFL